MSQGQAKKMKLINRTIKDTCRKDKTIHIAKIYEEFEANAKKMSQLSYRKVKYLTREYKTQLNSRIRKNNHKCDGNSGGLEGILLWRPKCHVRYIGKRTE